MFVILKPRLKVKANSNGLKDYLKDVVNDDFTNWLRLHYLFLTLPCKSRSQNHFWLHWPDHIAEHRSNNFRSGKQLLLVSTEVNCFRLKRLRRSPDTTTSYCRPRSKLSRHQLESLSNKIESFSFNLKYIFILFWSYFYNSCMHITFFFPSPFLSVA